MSREALVVGINKYQSTSGFQPLALPSEDANAIAQVLARHGGFSVRQLPQVVKEGEIQVGQTRGVTWQELEEALIQLFAPDGKDTPDTALFYFAGHGYRIVKGPVRRGYLVTTDGTAAKYGLEINWLRDLLRASKVKQQIVWLDCCQSGEFLDFEEADPKVEGEARDRFFIAASRGFELAYEQIQGNHGVLTGALLQGLSPDKCLPGQVISSVNLLDEVSKVLNEERQQRRIPQRFVHFSSGSPIDLIYGQGSPTETETKVLVDVPPYRGLQTFDFTDEDVKFFYGRTRLTDELLEKVWEQNFLAVVGPSGSGKSSVVRAGLLSSIQQGKKRSGTEHWKILSVVKPGEHPFLNLATAFENILDSTEPAKRAEGLRKLYSPDFPANGAATLTELVEEYNNPVLLVIDQFEEVFTLCQGTSKHDEERQQFFDCLLGALDQTQGKLRLVITMRADFLGKFLEQGFGGLADRIKTSTIQVPPMNSQELEEVITKPAELVGLSVQPELITRIIDDVQRAPGSLPLLEFALTELWNQWREGYTQTGSTVSNELTLTAYEQLGGIKGALEKRATQVFGELSEEEQTIAKRIFLELTQVGDGTEDTRRRVLVRALINDQYPEPIVSQVLNKLASERLIITDRMRMADSSQEKVVDVVHEALIRHWSLLREWIENYRDAIRIQRKLETQAEDWNQRGKGNQDETDFLLRRSQLAEAEEYLDKYGNLGHLNQLILEFIEVSQRAQERQEREKDEQIKVLTKFKLNEQAARASNLLSNQPQEALKLIVESVGENLEQLPEGLLNSVQACLNRAVETTGDLNKLYESPTIVTNAVAFSPTGHLIATGSTDNKIQLWDLQGNLQREFQGHTNPVNTIALSPDGNLIASGSADNTARVLDLQSNTQIASQMHSKPVTSVAFSPSGGLVASASVDKTVRLWDLTGKFQKTLKGHTDSVNSVAFNPDGQLIATGSADHTVRLWDLKGKLQKELRNHTDSVISVAFSPDGQVLASGSADSKVRLWDLQGNLLLEFHGHSKSVTSIAFSPDSQLIASGGADNMIWLWDLQGNIQTVFNNHTGNIISVAFSSDGQFLVSSSADKTVRLWDLQDDLISFDRTQRVFQGTSNVNSVALSSQGQLIVCGNSDNTVLLWDMEGNLQAEIPAHSKSVTCVAISPDYQSIVSGSADTLIRLWDLQGKLIKELQGHTKAVSSVTYSPNGYFITSASADNTVRLWDLNGNCLLAIDAHTDSVTSVAFSLDNQLIASGSSDRTVRLWNLQGNLLSELQGHDQTVTSVVFSPDNKFIASGSADRTVRLWDLQGNLIAQCQGHNQPITSVAFSPSSDLIASSSADRTVKLWNLQGELQLELKRHDETVTSVAFSSDGQLLVTGSEDKTVRLFDLRWRTWFKVCCDRLAYYLISKNPEADILQGGCRACADYIWSSDELAAILARQSTTLAR